MEPFRDKERLTSMRDIRQIIADNGGDNTPAMDSHNLTGRGPKCSFCGDALYGYGPDQPTVCRMCQRLYEYRPGEIAYND